MFLEVLQQLPILTASEAWTVHELVGKVLNKFFQWTLHCQVVRASHLMIQLKVVEQDFSEREFAHWLSRPEAILLLPPTWKMFSGGKEFIQFAHQIVTGRL